MISSCRRARPALPKPAAEVELLRLPRTQPVLDLLGILRRIAGELEGFARDHRGRLMMLAAAVPVGPQAGHDVGTDHPDQPDVVAR